MWRNHFDLLRSQTYMTQLEGGLLGAELLGPLAPEPYATPSQLRC